MTARRQTKMRRLRHASVHKFESDAKRYADAQRRRLDLFLEYVGLFDSPADIDRHRSTVSWWRGLPPNHLIAPVLVCSQASVQLADTAMVTHRFNATLTVLVLPCLQKSVQLIGADVGAGESVGIEGTWRGDLIN